MILIAPDKFKGTYTAQQVCDIVENRLVVAGIEERICKLPLSDGGEGIASVLMPEGRQVDQGIYTDGFKRLIVSSEIVGFEAFKNRNLPLMSRSSFNLGRAVTDDMPTIIAVGGTAVSDGGAGFLQGLGARFYDKDDKEIIEPLNPSNLREIVRGDISGIRTVNLSAIIDVKANFIDGPLNIMDFAVQKALPGEDLSSLKDSLIHFRSILGGKSEWDGAGGGLGYALASVCKVPCRSGAEAVINMKDIEWEKVSLVITGEGKIDNQTVYGGKMVDAVYKECLSRKIPCLMLYGKCEDDLPYKNKAQINEKWEDNVKMLCKYLQK